MKAWKREGTGYEEAERYAMQSAPWYTSILVYGAFTFVVLVICIVIKAVIKHKQKSTD